MSDTVIAAIIGSVAAVLAALINPWRDISQLSISERLLRDIALGITLGAIAGVFSFAIIFIIMGMRGAKLATPGAALLFLVLLGVAAGLFISFLPKSSDK